MNFVHTDTPSSHMEKTPELETLLPSVSVRTPGNISLVYLQGLFFHFLNYMRLLAAAEGKFCILCWGASAAVLRAAFRGLLGLWSHIHLYCRCAHSQETSGYINPHLEVLVARQDAQIAFQSRVCTCVVCECVWAREPLQGRSLHVMPVWVQCPIILHGTARTDVQTQKGTQQAPFNLAAMGKEQLLYLK